MINLNRYLRMFKRRLGAKRVAVAAAALVCLVVLVGFDALRRTLDVWGPSPGSGQIGKDDNDGEARDRHTLCLLVPFRDRFEELVEFVPEMTRFLSRQGVAHKIFVVNQLDGLRFNRASLINSGFSEAVLRPKADQAAASGSEEARPTETSSCTYVGMHDVDLIPLNDKLDYGYPGAGTPLHVAAPGLHPLYDYPTFVGGILLMAAEDFIRVDGMSNMFWGWGQEDDEFHARMKEAGLVVRRPNLPDLGSGKADTFKHIHVPPGHRRGRKRDTFRCKGQYLKTSRRDRLTGLATVSYKLLGRKELTVDGASCVLLNVVLRCHVDQTPWCSCEGAEPDQRVPLKRDNDTIVPIIKRPRPVKVEA